MVTTDGIKIMQAISDMRAELLDKVGEVESSVSGLKEKAVANIDAIKDTHDRFREELLGNGGRITDLEEEQKNARRRQWVHTSILIPIIGVLQSVARHLGWHI